MKGKKEMEGGRRTPTWKKKEENISQNDRSW